MTFLIIFFSPTLLGPVNRNFFQCLQDRFLFLVFILSILESNEENEEKQKTM